MNNEEINLQGEVTNTEKPVELTLPEETPSARKAASGKNWLYESLDLSRWFHYQTVIHHLPFILFLAGLGIFYIANAHYTEKSVRELNQMEKKMNEMRWQYMTTESDLEYLSKQSEVAKMLESEGVVELQEPPKKIELSTDEH